MNDKIPVSIYFHDPAKHKEGEWHPCGWAAMQATPYEYNSILWAAGIILAARGCPGLKLRLVSTKNEILDSHTHIP